MSNDIYQLGHNWVRHGVDDDDPYCSLCGIPITSVKRKEPCSKVQRSLFDDRTVVQGVGWEVIRVEGQWTIETEWLNDEQAVLLAHAILSEVEIAQQPTCDVCGSPEIADCICGEMYLCAEHLTAWETSPISHDDMDAFLAEQRRLAEVEIAQRVTDG